MAIIADGGYDTRLIYARKEVRPKEETLVGERPSSLVTQRPILTDDFQATWRVACSPEELVAPAPIEIETLYAHAFAITTWVSTRVEVKSNPIPVVTDYGYYRVFLTYVWTKNESEPSL